MEEMVNGPFAKSWIPMVEAYQQVKEEAANYARTVHETPDNIQARAYIIAQQAFGILSKRIKESDTYNEVLAMVFLSSAKDELYSFIGKFQDDIAVILMEEAQIEEPG